MGDTRCAEFLVGGVRHLDHRQRQPMACGVTIVPPSPSSARSSGRMCHLDALAMAMAAPTIFDAESGGAAVPSRLISADSHVNLSHEDIKGHLASRYHDDYDEAFGRWMSRRVENDGRVKANLGSHMTRSGYRDAQAHLEDMDTDGLDTEVVYCEVSAFRYLYLMNQGGPEATRAFNDTLADYGSTDPKRLIVSYQIPIHDIDTAVKEVERVAGAGGKSLQLPVFPTELGLPDYVDARYDPLWSAIQATGLPICCHTGFNTHLDDLQRRDPTPQAGITIPMMALSCGEALGMWVIGGLLERFPTSRLSSSSPASVGWRGGFAMWTSWWRSTPMCFPPSRSFPASTSAATSLSRSWKNRWPSNCCVTSSASPT